MNRPSAMLFTTRLRRSTSSPASHNDARYRRPAIRREARAHSQYQGPSSWAAAKDAGWAPNQLRSMGYPPPPRSRTSTPRASAPPAEVPPPRRTAPREPERPLIGCAAGGWYSRLPGRHLGALTGLAAGTLAGLAVSGGAVWTFAVVLTAALITGRLLTGAGHFMI